MSVGGVWGQGDSVKTEFVMALIINLHTISDTPFTSTDTSGNRRGGPANRRGGWASVGRNRRDGCCNRRDGWGCNCEFRRLQMQFGVCTTVLQFG